MSDVNTKLDQMLFMLEGQRKDTTELKQQMSDMIEEVNCLKSEMSSIAMRHHVGFQRFLLSCQ